MAEKVETHTAGERIAKVIARAGLASRREAEAWIAAGRVAVNGAVISSPALNVTAADRIAVDGAPLRARERTRLFLYHKPRGLVTTHSDPEGRDTIFRALPRSLPRLISVGRLDINTEGLLLLTNDGGLARVLELPATGWLRRYRVRALGRVRQEALDRLRGGITIDGIRYGPIEATLDREQGANVWLTFGIREGKNREVRKVLEIARPEGEPADPRRVRAVRARRSRRRRGAGNRNDPSCARSSASRSSPTPAPILMHRSRWKRNRDRHRHVIPEPTPRVARQMRGPMDGTGRQPRRASRNDKKKSAPPRPLGRSAAETSETALMRVVGGKLRSRPLAGPKSNAVRPTADRLREALFNILMHSYGDPVTGARVLDLFAGTGALGIEAMSRGAAYALFVDDGVEARALLRDNVETLGLGGVTRIFRRDADQARSGASDRAVFAGVPRSALRQRPGREGAAVGARGRMAQAGCLDRRGGSGRAGFKPPEGFTELERRSYDDTEFAFLRNN